MVCKYFLNLALKHIKDTVSTSKSREICLELIEI